MKAQNNYLYDFESFRIDAAKRQLLHGGQVLSLTSKAFSTLMFLVQNHGKIVTKEELMNAVWADTTVEENNLVQQISTLRKILGEQTRKPRFIATIPGEGYIFIAPVTEIFCAPLEMVEQGTKQLITVADTYRTQIMPANEQKSNGAFLESSDSQRLLVISVPALISAALIFLFLFFSALPDSKHTIGIAPFKALDNNEKSNFQSVGIPSYVTAKIGNLPNMIVRPIDLSGKYFGQEQNITAIGRENQVDNVLTGSTQSEGETVRVVVQLWDVKNSRLVWAKTFTGNASEAFSLQDTIAEEVVSALRN